MHRIKKLTAVILSVLTISSVSAVGSFTAGASGTGAGLAEWSLNAYNEGWSYSWGGSSPGAVDCSGLIWSYCGGDRMNMLSDAQANGRDWGYVDNGVPRVHGLGLSRPGHVGVYIADGMEVDARGDEYGVCYQEIGGWNTWDCWFKLTAVSYPENGWEEFNGDSYYYEDGEYIVNTSRTIDGTTYYFDSQGRSDTTPSDTSGTTTSSSSSSSSKKSEKQTLWQKGSNGDEVTKIQTRLAELGFYNGSIDGDFGDATDKAFKAFQKAAGLYVDGIAGSDREVLYSDDAPYAQTEKKEEKQEEKEEETAENNDDEQEATETETLTTLQNGDFNTEVFNVQNQLASLGYFGLDATGYFGDFTTEAIKAFQKINGLEETGVVDEATYELLFSENAAGNVIEETTEPEEEATEPTEETTVEETVPEITEEEPEVMVEEIEEPEYIEEPEVTETETEPATEAAAPMGPVLPQTLPTAPATVNNSAADGDYAANASNVAAKTNKVAENALADSSANVSSSFVAQVKRTANIWIWFVLVALILGVVTFFVLKRDRKRQKYASKKKSVRAQLNSKW